MNRYVCLLRGINVGGYKKIKMADLRAALTDIGLKEVSTYIQSGNVLFSSKEKDVDQLAAVVKEMLQSVFGFDIPVLVRSTAYWNQIAAANPFIKTGEEPLNQLLVTFLKDKPTAEQLDTIKDYVYKDDLFEIVDDAIYLYCRGGYGNTKLSNKFFEGKLKIQATTRNWKTVLKLTTMLEETQEK